MCFLIYIMLVIHFLFVLAAVAECRLFYASEVGCSIIQQKVPASSWEDARRRCDDDGFILASPVNYEMYKYLKALIGVNNHDVAYFIGTRAYELGYGQVEFRSVEGKELDKMPVPVHNEIRHLNLARGDCLSMDGHGIQPVSCWARLPFICYKSPVETEECGSAKTSTTPTTMSTTMPTTMSTTMPTTTTTTTTTTMPTTTTTTTTMPTTTTTTTTTTMAPTTPKLPSGYKYYNETGSAYKFYKSGKSWDVANERCVNESAHLVVVNDAAEADVVWRIVKDAGKEEIGTWIGMRGSLVGGTMNWATVNGEPLSDVFLEWGDGQPLNKAEQTCVSFYTRLKKIYNSRCNRRFNFICEISR